MSVLWLAVGLAMDAAAVCAARGLVAPRLGLREGLRVALLFGGTQALMPCLGALLGERLGPLFARWDHWLAFGLLGAIGVHMLLEAAKSNAAAEQIVAHDLFGLRTLFALAIATSLDALAAGIALPMLGMPLGPAVAMIGVVTAVLCVAALFTARRIGQALGPRFPLLGRGLDAFGGVVLIGIGTQILLEHLSDHG